jgi:hypothetical protein
MTDQTCSIPGCTEFVGMFDIALCYGHVEAAFVMFDAEEQKQARIWRQRMAGQQERLGGVYFVKVGEKIKVGFSYSPTRRLKQYPPGSEVLAIASNVLPAAEAEMHDRLTQFRVAGREWYRDCEEVRSVVAGIVEEHGKPAPIKWGSGQSRRRNPVSTTRRAAVVI